MHRKVVTHSNGSYERNSRGRKLADEMGRGKKFPWYTHRVMHRKRVTCELHDSYLRSMTITYAIPKIEWALNYYITQSRQLQLEIGRSYRRDVVGKATSGRRGLGVLMSWGPGKLLIRCSKESHHPAEWASSWASGERERHNVDGHKSGGQNIAVLFDLQLPFTRKPWITFSNTCNEVRGKYFYKKDFTRLLFIASVCILHEHVYENTTYVLEWMFSSCTSGCGEAYNICTPCQ